MQNNKSVELTPDTTSVLNKYHEKISQNSPFGQIKAWDEVDMLFPRMAKAKIVDLETGLSFRVQRRAGSLHADVQPLTGADTEIFKKIYQGRWSWKRRAVVLEVAGYKIAASMNGMPHGQGAIQGNNFPGHFCLHFLNTQTHSNNLDVAHQLMVWKAAGLIEDYLEGKSDKEMVEIALTALNQNDPQLVILTYLLNSNTTHLLNYMEKINGLKINSLTQGEAGNIYSVEIEWYELGSGNNYRERVDITVTKDEFRFLISPDQLVEIMVNKRKKQ
ncbi:MAG: hypothetical protein JM58_10890 [Peptococcaceae bacterium BICA1-8]|nr:MAG: hypothetical protein JM58_10890 [Peptococcaceae bacterium BICA1-8]